MTISLKSLPAITFPSDQGERELRLSEQAAAIHHLAQSIEHEFPGAQRIGLIWRSSPELVLLWFGILAAGREPLLLQYPNEKQDITQWRESISVSCEVAELGGIVIADDPRLRDIEAVPTYCPPALLFEPAAVTTSGDENDIRFDGAFLQMSSGTTGHRKPIRFELPAVAIHVERYNEILGLGPEDRIVSWLPLYHDMGFVACFLMPLLLGIPLVMIDPMQWVRRPALLAEAIRKHRGTICYMPNFGFEVMSRQGGDTPMPSMRLWISCSEPAYPDTMRRFARTFGVPETALAVCYAMAENIFAVTFRSGLRELPVEDGNRLSCGRPIPGTEIRLGDDGEVWVRSEISLNHYLNSPSIVDADGYYPTGDLGQLIDGELVVTGRKRDLLNVAGRKFLLNDLDQALQALVPEAKGRAVTVPWRNERLGTETPLFLIEADDFYLRTEQRAIGDTLGKQLGIEVAEVVFVPPGFIAKTSSGKTNRALTASHFRRASAARKKVSPTHLTLGDALAADYPGVPWDRPTRELFDSLGLTSLSIMLDEFDLELDPKLSIEQHLQRYRERNNATAPHDDLKPAHISIISLADARLTRQWSERHLETLSKALGCPVSFEYLCLPPVPVVLSDLIFHDYFLPREENPSAYREIATALTKLKNASIVLVDDVAELLFGARAFPFLDHRFQRSEQADLLIYRWQPYARNYHKLPIAVANLWNTVPLRNEYFERLGKYLGVPVFRIATLLSHQETTKEWDYVERVNADWTMELKANNDAMVEALAEFMRTNKTKMRLSSEPMRKELRHVGLVHFCCMAADKKQLDQLIARYERFCLFGPKSSLPYLRKRLEALGKSYVIADQSADLRAIEDQFDCVAQVGSTGRPNTSKPVFQIFWAAWEYDSAPDKAPYAGLDSRSFHGAPDDIKNELRLITGLPETPAEAIRMLKKYLRETECRGQTNVPPSPNSTKPTPKLPPCEVFPEFLAIDEANYAEAERLLASGRQAEAIAFIEAMVKGGTALWQAHNDLGVFALQRGDLDQAIDYLKVAAILEKDSTHALRNLAEACSQTGRVAEALAACAGILRREPDDPAIPVFIKNLLLASDAKINDTMWLTPERAAEQQELRRLRKRAEECKQQIAQLSAENTFFHRAKVLLDSLP